MNEKELLSNAALWFEQKHGHAPKKCGINFIQTWHKPTILWKLKTVVFAPTEEIGKAFILEQNILLRTMKYFCISLVVLFVFGFMFFYAHIQENKETVMAIVTIFTVLGLALFYYVSLWSKNVRNLKKSTTGTLTSIIHSNKSNNQ